MQIPELKEESKKINQLWKAVILRAIKDLYSKNYYERKDAQFFLFNNSKHLSRVCALADIEKNKLLKMKKDYEKGIIPQALFDYLKSKKEIKND